MNTVKRIREAGATAIRKAKAVRRTLGDRAIWAIAVVAFGLAMIAAGFSNRIEALSMLGFIPLAGGIVYLNIILWTWLLRHQDPNRIRNGYDL